MARGSALRDALLTTPCVAGRAPRRASLTTAACWVGERVAGKLVMLHAWLDTWSGLCAIVVGMQRHGYDLSLTHDRNGWRATFLHRSHALYPWVGQVLHWWPTPWRAVQEAAWRALSTPFTRDYSVMDDPPQ